MSNEAMYHAGHSISAEDEEHLERLRSLGKRGEHGIDSSAVRLLFKVIDEARARAKRAEQRLDDWAKDKNPYLGEKLTITERQVNGLMTENAELRAKCDEISKASAADSDRLRAALSGSIRECDTMRAQLSEVASVVSRGNVRDVVPALRAWQTQARNDVLTEGCRAAVAEKALADATGHLETFAKQQDEHGRTVSLLRSMLILSRDESIVDAVHTVRLDKAIAERRAGDLDATLTKVWEVNAELHMSLRRVREMLGAKPEDDVAQWVGFQKEHLTKALADKENLLKQRDVARDKLTAMLGVAARTMVFDDIVDHAVSALKRARMEIDRLTVLDDDNRRQSEGSTSASAVHQRLARVEKTLADIEERFAAARVLLERSNVEVGHGG